ncbi:MAG: GxxExxY protein [Micropepsaceae bacterium]
MELEEIVSKVVHCCFVIHRELGPGLLESVYEGVLADILQSDGILVERQIPMPVRFRNIHFEIGFRADLMIARKLLIELKAIETTMPVHTRQVLTYLRLLDLPLGLLVNFGTATFKGCVQRIANNYKGRPHHSWQGLLPG